MLFEKQCKCRVAQRCLTKTFFDFKLILIYLILRGGSNLGSNYNQISDILRWPSSETPSKNACHQFGIINEYLQVRRH